jgi:hypothetical protein
VTDSLWLLCACGHLSATPENRKTRQGAGFFRRSASPGGQVSVESFSREQQLPTTGQFV